MVARKGIILRKTKTNTDGRRQQIHINERNFYHFAESGGNYNFLGYQLKFVFCQLFERLEIKIKAG